MKLCERLRLLIEKVENISQNEFCRRVGLSPQTLSKYLTPEKESGVKVIFLLIKSVPVRKL